MHIRPLQMTCPEEAIAAARVEATAFRSPQGYCQLLSDLKQGKTLQDPETSDPPRMIWGAFAGEELVAVTTAISLQMLYEDLPVCLCGVGGVATLPEYRRRGAIRAIFAALLRHARSQGQIFSYLFPFSFAFYGQFGYGPGCNRYRAELPMNLLLSMPETGQVRAMTQADRGCVQNIYEQFITGSNGAIIRSGANWEKHFNRDRFAEQYHTYIWQNEKGQDAAYMTFETLRGKDGRTLHIQDWACSSLDGMRAMLSFLKRFSDPYDAIDLFVPLHIHLANLFPEPGLISHFLETYGQIRVLNIKEALIRLLQPEWLHREIRFCAKTKSDLDLNIRVTDSFLPENSGLYQLSLDSDLPTVLYNEKPPDDAPFDLSVSERVLATLLLGSQGLFDLIGHPEMTMGPHLSPERIDLLGRFLKNKKNGIYDYF